MRYIKQFALILALALTAQGTAQVVDVVWWDFLSGGDGIRMKALIEEFNAEHPNINISGTTLEWGVPYYTRVQTAIPVGEGPDVMTFHTSRIPLSAPSGIFRPITDEDLASVGLAKSDYFEAAIQGATYNDQLMCVPLDIHSHILYYNRDILRSVGLIGDDGLPIGLDGADNFYAALEKIQNEAGVLPLSLAIDSGSVWRLFYSLLSQQDGPPLIDGNEVYVGEEARLALQTIRGWVEAGLAPDNAEYAASIALFTSGQAAMHFNGVWESTTMKDLAARGELFDWGAIAYPTFFDRPATWADSHCFAIPANARRPISAEKLDAVMTAIAWMNRNSLPWAGAGHIPAYVAVVESPEYALLEPNATYAVLADTAQFDPASPVAGVASPLFDAVDNVLVPAIGGLLPIDEALQMFEQELESNLF
jgi:multiple sugar transport system substrate-binding protein